MLSPEHAPSDHIEESDKVALSTPPETTLNVDQILTNSVGAFGLWQWSLVMISILVVTPNATFPIFANSEPMHRCRMEPIVESIFMQRNMTFEKSASLIGPWNDLKYMVHGAGCHRFKTNWTDTVWLSLVLDNRSSFDTDELEPCPFGYIYEYGTTQYPSGVVAEFNTVCDYQWLTPLSSSLYILGMLLGFIGGGWCSDRFGRKTTILSFSVIEALSGLTVSLAPTYTIYALARTTLASAVTGKIVSLSVLQMEITVAKYRSVLSATGTLGHNFVNRSLLALYAYSIPEWRFLNATLVTPLIFTFLFWWMPESPRWLYSKNRIPEAIEALIVGYKINFRMRVDQNVVTALRNISKAQEQHTKRNYRELLNVIYKKMKCTCPTICHHKSCSNSAFAPLLKVTLLSGSLFCGTVFSYFGLLYYARIINLPIYLTAFISATTVIPGTFIFALLYRFVKRRKPPLMAFSLITSLVLLTGYLYNYFGGDKVDVILIICVNIALTFLGSSLSMLYIYVPELFPSQIRTQGLGLASGMGRVAGFWCTFINNLHRSLSAGFPLLIYAVLSFCTTGVLLFLRDTDGENLPDFLIAERRKSDSGSCSLQSVGKQ